MIRDCLLKKNELYLYAGIKNLQVSERYRYSYMTKQEISEIKKLFTQNNCSITRICGCYVDGEKNKKTELKQAFLALPEEECLNILKFSGKICPALRAKICSLWIFP